MKNKTKHVTGVTWCQSKGKYRVRLKRNNKDYNLGYFENHNDAIKARQAAEDEHLSKTRAKHIALPQVGPEIPSFDFDEESSKKSIFDLKKQVNTLKKERLTAEEIRKYIFELKDTAVNTPTWLINTHNVESIHGVPTLVLSDWHMGEVVDPKSVFGKNEFNMAIAQERIKILARNTIDLLTNHLKDEYPGIVVLLAGDFVSGVIHDELLITNEEPIMPVVLRTQELLAWFINQMHDAFGNVQLFCVHGNHSRTFKKITFKEAALSSYDWLIYNLLDRHFQDNPSINFQIADGDDLQYRIYNYKYRVSHGSQFRGGQGYLGSISPITRGEMRKRNASESYGEGYDRLIIGHFHQYQTLSRVTVNGSLIGFNEYAISNLFPWERPQQALFMTHPLHNLTFSCPVFCTESEQAKESGWVSWKQR